MKKTLKFLAVLFCLCLVTGVALSVQAEESAAQSALALQEAEDGYVRVTLSTQEAMAGLSGKIVYDETKLSYAGTTFTGASASNNTAEDSILNEGGNLQFVLVGDVKNGTSGEWMTVTFTVKKAGKTEMKLQDVVGADTQTVSKSLTGNSVEADARMAQKSVDRQDKDPQTGVKKITTAVVIVAAISAVVLVLLFCFKKKPTPDETASEISEAENQQNEEGKEE